MDGSLGRRTESSKEIASRKKQLLNFRFIGYQICASGEGELPPGGCCLFPVFLSPITSTSGSTCYVLRLLICSVSYLYHVPKLGYRHDVGQSVVNTNGGGDINTAHYAW